MVTVKTPINIVNFEYCLKKQDLLRTQTSLNVHGLVFCCVELSVTFVCNPVKEGNCNVVVVVDLVVDAGVVVLTEDVLYFGLVASVVWLIGNCRI
ncbi:hypothetical protein [Bufonid herpesvirus 1]|uniref:hypothetical protein n=1 Tax=Bufonid herpesvirus 1 TaxID=2282206 RepID=UPI000EB72E26|nr:hypothetical protein [Bufonid herpesvirus 1]AXF48619.1 hypothetical protein [Bufonid herpesvirus 1]